jgi:hypothetical protein
MWVWIPARDFCALMDETVIIIVGGKALFSVLCVLVNGKGSSGAGSSRAGHRVTPWEVYGACRWAAFSPCRVIALSSTKCSSTLHVAQVSFTE